MSRQAAGPGLISLRARRRGFWAWCSWIWLICFELIDKSRLAHLACFMHYSRSPLVLSPVESTNSYHLEPMPSHVPKFSKLSKSAYCLHHFTDSLLDPYPVGTLIGRTRQSAGAWSSQDHSKDRNRFTILLGPLVGSSWYWARRQRRPCLAWASPWNSHSESSD